MRRRGFSLLEVLLAMVILTVGATSLIALFAAAAATHKRSVDRTRASMVAEEVMSEVQARFLPGTTLDALAQSLLADLPEAIDGYRWSVYLCFPGEEGGAQPPLLVRHGGEGGTRKAAAPSGKTAVRPAPKRPSGKKAADDDDGWSEEELLVRVMVGWSQSGQELSQSYDTLLLPRPRGGAQ